VNRFDYDFERDAMMKKNDQFRFAEILDMDSVLPEETNQSQAATVYHKKGKAASRNLYHLHSILIHRGTLGAGHYFAFIRPSLTPDWYEFNDSTVTPIA
jgi:ubiquitin carboxyl-terminal hydrolase 7